MRGIQANSRDSRVCRLWGEGHRLRRRREALHKEDAFESIGGPNEEVIYAFGMCHGSSGLEVLLVLTVCAWHLDSLGAS